MIKAVVICENHTLDEHIIKPVIHAVFQEAGQRVAIQVLSNPLIHGINQALSRETHSTILNQYPMADSFFLIVDRDCEVDREKQRFKTRIEEAAMLGKTMLGCVAIEELEVWALALWRKEIATDWKVIRAECHPKEIHFEPFAKLKGWQTAPGKGRKSAMQNFGKNEWESLKSLCPELGKLTTDVKEWLRARH